MSKVRRFALLGQSISYSKSPDIFAAIARETGRSIVFELRSIEPANLDNEVSALVGSGCDGFLLTIPFKEQIISRLNQIDLVAAQIRSVNSVQCRGKHLMGYNTDLDGFLFGLKPYYDSIRKHKCLLLGAGGAARAVLYGLLTEALVSDVTVVSRAGKSASIPSPNVLDSDKVKAVSFDILSELQLDSFSLIVNATPLGGWNALDTLPLPEKFKFAENAVYYDLNYNADNPAIRFAKTRGCTTINGSRMLVAQALKAYLILTGEVVPFDPIYRAVFGEDFHA